jgi:hypothetical protein
MGVLIGRSLKKAVKAATSDQVNYIVKKKKVNK